MALHNGGKLEIHVWSEGKAIWKWELTGWDQIDKMQAREGQTYFQTSSGRSSSLTRKRAIKKARKNCKAFYDGIEYANYRQAQKKKTIKTVSCE